MTPPWDVPDPPPLPATPALIHLAFESPSLLAVAILVLAGVAWKLLRGTPRKVAAGLGVSLAVALWVVAGLVETSRETMEAGARALVRDVAAANGQAVRAALRDDARLFTMEHASGTGPEEIAEEVRGAFGPGGRFHLKECAVLEVEAAEVDPGRGSVQIKVRAVPDAIGAPIMSWWRLDYREGPPGVWRVDAIKPLSISGVANPGG